MGTDGDCLDQQLRDIIERDDKNEFVRITTSTQLNKPHEDLERIIGSNAVKCATALLNGETGQEIDLNCPFPSSQMTPLHQAAASGCFELVELFLHHNAHTDLRCNCEGQKHHHMLPLNLVLENISTSKYLASWTPSQSIFKMLINLCLPTLRSRLKVVELLFWSTKEVEKEIYHYAKGGKLVELAVLLLVGREKVISPTLFQRLSPSLFPSQGDSGLHGSMTLYNFVITELTLLVALEAKQTFYGDSYNVAKICKEKQAMKISTLLLLQVFERAGDDIEAYLRQEQTIVEEQVVAEGVTRKIDVLAVQVAKEVVCLLQRAGFGVNNEDTSLRHLDRYLPVELDWHDSTLHDYLPKKWESQKLDLTLWERMNLGIFQPDEQKGKKCLKHSSAQCERKSNKLENLSTTGVSYAKWRMSSAPYLDEYLNLVVQSFKTLQDSRASLNCEDGLGFHDSRPLCQALELLCNHPYLKDWTSSKSIVKLVYILCSPELRGSLNKIRLLACKSKEIGVMSCHYAMKGKLVELATLLMVAREKLMTYDCEGVFGETTMIHQCIITEIQNRFDGKIRLIGRNWRHSLSQLQKDKKKMLSALQLVEVFERAGVAIDKFCRSIKKYKVMTKEEMVVGLAWLLEVQGFDLSENDKFVDDLKCFSVNQLREKESEKLVKDLQNASGMKFCAPLSAFPILMRLDAAMACRTKYHRSSLQRRHASSSSLAAIGSPHKFKVPAANSCLESFLSMGVETSQTAKKFESCSSNVLSCKKWSSVLLTITRGIKGV